MLHSCDAGEYSVLSNYLPDFFYEDINGSKHIAYNNVTNVMVWYGTTAVGDWMPVNGATNLDRNSGWHTKPFEVGSLSAQFIFSHGHYILNAGYSKHFDKVF